jgi:hypothetical protein
MIRNAELSTTWSYRFPQGMGETIRQELGSFDLVSNAMNARD